MQLSRTVVGWPLFMRIFEPEALYRRRTQHFLDPSLEEVNAIQGGCVFLSRCKYTGQSTMREHGSNGNGRGNLFGNPST